jgi:hypothetical protein
VIAFIDAHRGLGIEPICRELEIAPSTYQPLLNFEWVAARIDPSLGPLSEAT